MIPADLHPNINSFPYDEPAAEITSTYFKYVLTLPSSFMTLLSIVTCHFIVSY